MSLYEVSTETSWVSKLHFFCRVMGSFSEPTQTLIRQENIALSPAKFLSCASWLYLYVLKSLPCQDERWRLQEWCALVKLYCSTSVFAQTSATCHFGQAFFPDSPEGALWSYHACLLCILMSNDLDMMCWKTRFVSRQNLSKSPTPVLSFFQKSLFLVLFSHLRPWSSRQASCLCPPCRTSRCTSFSKQFGWAMRLILWDTSQKFSWNRNETMPSQGEGYLFGLVHDPQPLRSLNNSTKAQRANTTAARHLKHQNLKMFEIFWTFWVQISNLVAAIWLWTGRTEVWWQLYMLSLLHLGMHKMRQKAEEWKFQRSEVLWATSRTGSAFSKVSLGLLCHLEIWGCCCRCCVRISGSVSYSADFQDFCQTLCFSASAQQIFRDLKSYNASWAQDQGLKSSQHRHGWSETEEMDFSLCVFF